ncbi:MAG: hypothetical protein KKC68_05225 [Candidatus Thermoplasmatota archaeon]|nr:hypothetical protein [Candidatus Thermoplasmatota archaeon]MBU1941156.1 hypothetical protein [Candidatus Thermoplasmatota archaeon]
MNKKTLAVVLCMLFLPTVPLVTATTEPIKSEENTTDSIFGWTIIRGYVFNLQKMGNDLVFRAIRVHFTEITGLELRSGVIKFKQVAVSDFGPDRRVYMGVLGAFVYLFAICKGGIQIMD